MSESVYEIFQNKTNRAVAAAEKRSAEVRARDGRIAEIDRELSEMGMRIFATALKGGEDRDREFNKLQTRISMLNAEKKERLRALGLPEDYTDIKYECSKCSDTGYQGYKMCDCMKKALLRQNYERSGIGKYLENQTFESFDLKYYPEKVRSNMSNVLKDAKEYAEKFDASSSTSLLFMGSTGLGKTHISSAIAKKVIEKGCSVVYDSAHNIISAFERDRFAKDGEVRSDRYLDADLLIIDDLGSEIQSKSSTSYFYTVINTRLIASKPTIVSTNLNPKELTEVYDTRIVSRLFGEYKVLIFEGEDIRKAKRT